MQTEVTIVFSRNTEKMKNLHPYYILSKVSRKRGLEFCLFIHSVYQSILNLQSGGDVTNPNGRGINAFRNTVVLSHNSFSNSLLLSAKQGHKVVCRKTMNSAPPSSTHTFYLRVGSKIQPWFIQSLHLLVY